MAREERFRVVVASDGSPRGRAAAGAAVAFPWPDGSRVAGVIARSAALGAAQWTAAVWAAVHERDVRLADDLRATLSRRWPDAEVTVVERPAVDAIADAADGADAVVVGSRGLGAVGRAFLGSVSRGVLRRVSCPVLVVKKSVRRVASLVIGVDGSDSAQRAVAFVAGLPAPRGGRVALVTAVERVRPQSLGLIPGGLRGTLAREVAAINARRLAEAREVLAAAAPSLRSAGWAVRTVVRHGVPLDELLTAVRTARADVLVVGARGTGGFDRLLLGSVAEGALARSPVSVLIVR